MVGKGADSFIPSLTAGNATIPAALVSPGVATIGRPRGARVVFDGDSITFGATTNDVSGTGIQDRGSSWPACAEQSSGGRLELVFNAAVAGQRSDQMLARFDSVVAPLSPDAVVVTVGTNDILQSQPMASWLANLEEYRVRLGRLGAVLIVGAVPPLAQASGAAAAWNVALREWARGAGVRVIPFDAFIDPATGGWPAGWSADGLHPNLLDSRWRLGVFAWESIADLFGGAVLKDAGRFGSGSTTNGLFTSVNGGTGLPTDATYGSATPMFTGFGVFSDEKSIRGSYVRLKPRTDGQSANLTLTTPGSATPGQRWELSGLVRGNTSGYAAVRLRTGTTSVTNVRAWTGLAPSDGSWARFRLGFVVPSGIDNVLPLLVVDAGSDSAYLDFAEVRLAPS